MKLTNDMRDKVILGLDEKAFPKSELERLKKALANAVMDTDEYREARNMYLKHGKYVSPSTTVCTDIYTHYLSTRKISLTLPLSYACVKGGWCFDNLSVARCDKDRVTSEGIEKAYEELSDFCERMGEFNESISQVVKAYTSTAKLIEAIPDAAEFLPKDNGCSALVPKDQIDGINKALGRAV